MSCLERLPALTARSVLELIQSIKSDVAKKGKGWFSSYSEQLKQTHTIPEDLHKIKQETSNKLILKTDWTNLNTRMFQAETGICHKFQLMEQISSNENSQDINSEFERLQTGILNVDNGVLSNLSVIHRLLVGQSVTNPFENGLLEMWSTGLHENMRINLLSAKRHQAYIDKYLDNAAILQFKGILLFTEANTNSRFSSLQMDLFEHNLKYQIKTKEKTVSTYMRKLTDPDENTGFFLRPVFDGKDEPLLVSQGVKKRLAYDYMCGYPEEGKWFFEKSQNFDEDGSLIISGISRCGKHYYMSVSEKNIAECVAYKHCATPFDVIPMDYSDDKLKIGICKTTSKPGDKKILGTSLTFIDGNEDIEFTLSFDRGGL